MACSNKTITKGLSYCSTANAKSLESILIAVKGDFSYIQGSPNTSITTITPEGSPVQWFKVEFGRNQATFTETGNYNDDSQELESVNQVIEITWNKNDKEKRDFLESLRGVCIEAIITDRNKEIFLGGETQGFFVTGGVRTWNTDTNNMTMTLTATEELYYANSVLSSALVGLPISQS